MLNPTNVLRTAWSTTLQLPKSSFPARATLADRPTYLKQCTDDLYAWQRAIPNVERTFILNDGPPYANGSLHIGHALNKVLKDIICRFQLLQGKQVEYIPGWDCHGLPIELKALQRQEKLGQLAEDRQLGAIGVRNAARQLAADTVAEQKRGFRQWGIMADWNNAWTTMDKNFELGQLRVFKTMVERGLVYRRFKPVYWSPSTHTALAEAELEYKSDHVSQAAFVKFPLLQLPKKLSCRLGALERHVNAVIWTTTPWTLPANRAIAVHSDLDYAFVNSLARGTLLIAASRLPYVEKLCNEQFTHSDVGIVRGSDLLGAMYRHPIQDDNAPPQKIIHADFVSAESGSGLVHVAPGHGMEDYKLCQQHGIETYAPVDDYGCFTANTLPDKLKSLAGKDVLKAGNEAVLEYLAEHNFILVSHTHIHNYPYDWRSKQPVIIRATEQWFADVGEIREAALNSLATVEFIPQAGRERLSSFVRNRSEWCISRQRAWGVPIPALYHKGNGSALLTAESVEHIISIIQARGIDSWWTDDEWDPIWTPPKLRDHSQFRRGRDTMDVWFDSGTSWTQMDNKKQESTPLTADVYIEGTDQHRGWFQSSLLTSIACQTASEAQEKFRAPYKTLITHGFTLDQHGKKMSKSVGNVVSPDEIMSGTLLDPIKNKRSKDKQNQIVQYDALGPDALRLWVARCDFTSDVVVGKPVLRAVNVALTKFRVTFKLLLGLLESHKPDRRINFQDLGAIDQIALMDLRNLIHSVRDAYRHFEFHKGISAITQYIVKDLSAFYIESIKDRLYAEHVESRSRINAQIVLWEILKQLTSVLAPITPLLVEETCNYLPKALSFHPVKDCWNDGEPPTAVDGWPAFLKELHIVGGIAVDWPLRARLPYYFAANTAVKAAQEVARVNKKMGSSLQSFVMLQADNTGNKDSVEKTLGFYRDLDALEDLFVVSKVEVGFGPTPAQVLDAAWVYDTKFEVGGQSMRAYVYEPQQRKCARCWKYTIEQQSALEDDAICSRCEHVMQRRELDTT